jgi:GDP-L-fucose synthase
MNKTSKIYVAGHLGLVGSAIWNNLQNKGYTNLIGKSIDELDLMDTAVVADFFREHKPEYIFLAAAKVGGIVANNTYRGQFIYENLMIQNNIIHQAYLSKVKKLLFLGSTCIYPREAPQPMREDSLLTSPLEYTNEPYAIAKIAGIKMCESYNLQYGTNFLSVMPTNLYGPNDNFNLETSHVLPALIRKMYLAKCLEKNNQDDIKSDLKKRPIENVSGTSNYNEIISILARHGIIKKNDKISVEVWGSGKPKREFLWSEEMADACVYVMEKVNFPDLCSGKKEIRNTHINIGTGEEISIRELAFLIKRIIGFNGDLVFNSDKPDGSMQKLTEPSKIHELGWHHKIGVEKGVKILADWYQNDLVRE